jgi:hypothetical protein
MRRPRRCDRSPPQLLAATADGVRTLTMRDAQHEYVFREID